MILIRAASNISGKLPNFESINYLLYLIHTSFFIALTFSLKNIQTKNKRKKIVLK